jgi:hypothetical protein
MKKFISFAFVVLLLSNVQILSQTDSLENEIKNYQNSKSDLISKGRRLLLDNFVLNDMNKVREIMTLNLHPGAI